MSQHCQSYQLYEADVGGKIAPFFKNEGNEDPERLCNMSLVTQLESDEVCL